VPELPKLETYRSVVEAVPEIVNAVVLAPPLNESFVVVALLGKGYPKFE